MSVLIEILYGEVFLYVIDRISRLLCNVELSELVNHSALCISQGICT